MVVAHREQFEPADRAGWRQWLAGHHDTSPGVWLVLHRKGAGPRPLTLDDAVEEALCFGWIDSTQRRLDEGRSLLQFTPRRAGGTWSRTNKSRVARLVEQGLMTPAGLRAVERARSDGSWTLLDSIDAVSIPPDLAAALARDPVATAGFDAMTTSEKKSALWWIASAKRPATRLARIEETIRRAAAAERTLDDYLDGLDVSSRAAFEHIRTLVMELAPDAEQGMSYGMAALKYKQKPLIAFLAAKHHLSIFPCSSRVVDSVRDQLMAFDLSKGTIRFTAATPLPDEVVRDIVRLRMGEISGTVR